MTPPEVRAFVLPALLALATGCVGRPVPHASALSRGATEAMRSTDLAERPWTDERGETVRLATWRGTPLVVSMFYRTCKFRCPMTLAKLRRVEASFLRAGQPIAFVLITLDPENDTPERLASFKKAEHLGDASWHLLNGDRATTREFSQVLRLRAFKDDTHIDHDVQIAVFDAAGRLTRSFRGWDFDDTEAIVASRP